MIFFMMVVVLGTQFSGCSSVGINLDKKALQKIKKVAVIVFTIPNSIEFKDDPREIELNSNYMSFADPVDAANSSLKNFITILNSENMGFKVVTVQEMLKNYDFLDLYTPTQKREKRIVLWPFTKSVVDVGISPENISSFGIHHSWNYSSALMGLKREKEYIQNAINVLEVDAAIVITDNGYSFSCFNCLGGSGTVTTASAFNLVMVDREGEEILAIKDLFLNSGTTIPIVSGEIAIHNYKKLFREHGKKLAHVIASLYKQKLSK